MSVRIVKNSLLFKVVPFLWNYEAIVIGRYIHFKGNGNIKIMQHEMVHQKQMDEHGVLKFYLIYIKDYLKLRLKGYSHNDAYMNIPFEKEAYGHSRNNN